MASAKIVEAKIQQQWSRSNIVDPEREKRLPRFTMEQLAKGKFLGKGGFCTVDEIKPFQSAAVVSKKGGTDEEVAFEDRDFIIKNSKRASNGDARYAIKYLSPEVIQDKSRYLQGLADFATETHFLTVINHPNIVKLRAVAEGTPFSDRYFLVLDRLYDILDVKIPKWGKQSKNKLMGQKKKRELLEERLVAAADLSDALGFMHRHNIIYRDVKAENVGFNVRGKITLFDFGLPKELHDADRLPDGNWKLSGHTGTLRYMSPEVFKSVPYNYSCDVYSFSILLWEMMAMERAFAGYNLKRHQERVLLGGHRPTLNPKWPTAVCDVLHRGWVVDTSARPTMEKVTQILRKEVAIMQGKDPESVVLRNTRVGDMHGTELDVKVIPKQVADSTPKEAPEAEVENEIEEDELSC